MNLNSLIDIKPEDLKTVQAILIEYIPDYEVWAFGSRITGKARKYSDLDLTVITKEPLDIDLYAALKEAFSESDLPFKVDVVDWATANDNFKKIMEEKFVVIQKVTI